MRFDMRRVRVELETVGEEQCRPVACLLPVAPREEHPERVSRQTEFDVDGWTRRDDVKGTWGQCLRCF